MPAKKDTCPDCKLQKDCRAIRCNKCRFIFDHPRKGTGAAERIGANGYVMVQVDNKEAYQHRHVMESILGRKLRSDEHVHHINGIKTDNRPENLQVMAACEHHREHFTPEFAKAASIKGHAARWGARP